MGYLLGILSISGVFSLLYLLIVCPFLLSSKINQKVLECIEFFIICDVK